MDEKRQYYRLKDKVKLVYKVSGETKKRTAKTLDVGAGGLCLPLVERVKPGLLLELSLYLPEDTQPFKLSGKIAWQRPIPKKDIFGDNYYETGIEFQQMSLKEKLQIIHYVHTEIKNKSKKTP